ncbi:MAG: MFS transporter [Pyrinomonadaceae bacterium]
MSSELKNDKREIFGWLVYDWANSVYLTTVIGVLVGPYLTALAQAAVGDNGVVLDLGVYAITAKSLFPFAISMSVFGQIFLLPILGAIADYSRLKKRFMQLFCFAGAATGCLLFFVEGNWYLFGSVLVIFSNLCMGGSLVFYNAYLSDICTADQRDKVSSRGFAVGYAGGFLMLLFNFIFLSFAERLGITQGFAVRISFLLAAVWWGGFALFTFARLKNRGAAREIPPGENYVSVAFKELGQTFRELIRLRHTAQFLIGYLLYNDGIQTVINISSLYIAQELFVNKGLPEDNAFLLEVFLLAQFMAVAGSFAFEFIARRTGAKYAILLSLIIWAGIVIYAYGFLRETWQAWIMGASIGFVLGGSQALSRSLFSQMIPPGRESAFFSIYEISERGTSWIGPVVFGVVASVTNSYRQAILALIVFFIVGSIMLYFTNTDKAIAEAELHM